MRRLFGKAPGADSRKADGICLLVLDSVIVIACCMIWFLWPREQENRAYVQAVFLTVFVLMGWGFAYRVAPDGIDGCVWTPEEAERGNGELREASFCVQVIGEGYDEDDSESEFAYCFGGDERVLIVPNESIDRSRSRTLPPLSEGPYYLSTRAAITMDDESDRALEHFVASHFRDFRGRHLGFFSRLAIVMSPPLSPGIPNNSIPVLPVNRPSYLGSFLSPSPTCTLVADPAFVARWLSWPKYAVATLFFCPWIYHLYVLRLPTVSRKLSKEITLVRGNITIHHPDLNAPNSTPRL